MIGDILQPTHLLFILVVALLVLGPKRLPEVGRSLGRGLRDFRSALSGDDHHDEVVAQTSEPTHQPLVQASVATHEPFAPASGAPEEPTAQTSAATEEPAVHTVTPTETAAEPAPEPVERAG